MTVKVHIEISCETEPFGHSKKERDEQLAWILEQMSYRGNFPKPDTRRNAVRDTGGTVVGFVRLTED